MTNIFATILKATREFNAGKIQWYPNGFTFGSLGCTNNQGYFLKPSKDLDGKDISLVLGQRTAFNCPIPTFQDTYPRLKSGYSTPASVCRKCRHYLKPQRGANFSRCELLQQLRANRPSPEQTLVQLAKQAQDKALEMLKP